MQLQFPEEKRNLIYIFLESMEVTYSDKENGGAFDVNYIPELTALAQEYEDFSGSDSALNGGYDMPSTTWTAAALFAQSSGLPLSISIEGNSMNTQDEFMPNVVMIGDILEDAGYNQMFLIGSNATFGGRRLMYSQFMIGSMPEIRGDCRKDILNGGDIGILYCLNMPRKNCRNWRRGMSPLT